MPRKEIVGTVKSAGKMDKTVVLEVQTKEPHGKYGKYTQWTKSFKVHDPENVCRTGDVIRVVECRPLSKDKKFQLVSVVKTAADT